MIKKELIPKDLFFILEDDGIKDAHRNGGRKQTIIIKSKKTKRKYKISILSETIIYQSYANIYQWSNEVGWELISKRNPKSTFGIDISHKSDYKQDAFVSIIKSLIFFIKNWEE